MAPKNEMKQSSGFSSSNGEIDAIIHELAAARRAGQTVDYVAAEQAHQKLMPELGNRIRMIQAMEMAAVTPNGASSAEEFADSLESDQNSAAEFLREALEGYEILEQFDYGGQGRVFKAIQTATNRTVAIKVLLDGPLATKRHRDRFIREIELVSRLKEPGVVTVYDSGTLRDRPYLVMEFVDGLPIDDYVCAERPDVKGRIQLFLQVCNAIAAAHRHGIIHRDLKPTNILVDGNGRVHVLDFGLAKEVGDASRSGTRAVLSQTGLIVGTLRYLSPEQAWGHNGSIDTRSDVYTLGVILFELLTGLPPYPTNGARETVLHRIRTGEATGLRRAIAIAGGDGVVEPKHIDRDLETILLRCLTKEPDRRYQSVVALSDDLERYVRGDVIEARADSGLYLLRKTFSRYRGPAIIVAVVIVLSIVVLAVTSAMSKATARTAQIGIEFWQSVYRAEYSSKLGQTDKAIDLLEKITSRGMEIPLDNALVWQAVFAAHHNLSDLYIESNRLEDAERHSDRVAELTEVLLRNEPDNPEWLRLASFSRKQRGRAAIARKEWEQALTEFEEVLAIRKRLAERLIGESQTRVELAHAHAWVAKAARAGGQLKKAELHNFEAYAEFERLLQDDPKNSDVILGLGHSEARMAFDYMSYNDEHHDIEAMSWFERSRDRLTQHLESGEAPSNDRAIRRILVSVKQNMARIKKRLEPRPKESPPS